MLNVRSRAPTCEHVPAQVVTPRSDVCEDCGSTFNLRMCASCGNVGCCESQAGHNTAHARASGHPVIYSIPVGTGFTWCYDHNQYVGGR
jgi:uncharacterized UBP type Zn finger protein